MSILFLAKFSESFFRFSSIIVFRVSESMSLYSDNKIPSSESSTKTSKSSSSPVSKRNFKIEYELVSSSSLSTTSSVVSSSTVSSVLVCSSSTSSWLTISSELSLSTFSTSSTNSAISSSSISWEELTTASTESLVASSTELNIRSAIWSKSISVLFLLLLISNLFCKFTPLKDRVQKG